VSSIVWTPIDNGKLANQIARLAAIEVKIGFSSYIIMSKQYSIVLHYDSDNKQNLLYIVIAVQLQSQQKPQLI